MNELALRPGFPESQPPGTGGRKGEVSSGCEGRQRVAREIEENSQQQIPAVILSESLGTESGSVVLDSVIRALSITPVCAVGLRLPFPRGRGHSFSELR